MKVLAWLAHGPEVCVSPHFDLGARGFTPHSSLPQARCLSGHRFFFSLSLLFSSLPRFLYGSGKLFLGKALDTSLWGGILTGIGKK